MYSEYNEELNEEEILNAVTTVTEAAAAIAVAQAQKDTSARNGMSMIPLSPGRLAFEALYYQVKEPYHWSSATSKPWLPLYPAPNDWEERQAVVDEDGNDLLDSNGEIITEFKNNIRREHYNYSPFISDNRARQYVDLLVASQEAKYLSLFSTKISRTRWSAEVESIIRTSKFWWDHYCFELGISRGDKDPHFAGSTSDGGSPSNLGLTPVES